MYQVPPWRGSRTLVQASKLSGARADRIILIKSCDRHAAFQQGRGWSYLAPAQAPNGVWLSSSA